jgi:phage terminase large subunit
VIDYNPTHSFWANEIIELRDNCQRVHSTYLDNDYLTPEQVAEIESNRSDANWWTVYGEGKVGSLEGVIYQFDVIDHMPPKGSDKPESQKTDEERYADSLKEVWGLDFGFTHDPTAIVRILADPKRKEAYLEQKCYQTNMMNEDIAERLKFAGIGSKTEIYADCAEPKSIAEIGKGSRFNIKSCDKGAPVKSEKLKFQIQWVQGWKLFVTKDSLDLMNELRNYVWSKDKTGKELPIPIDSYSHLLDAARYALWSKFGRNAGKGSYNISIK